MTSNKPILYVAIGPSGSGKSTLFEKLQKKDPNLVHYSWDALRLEWYNPNDYADAWEKSCADRDFRRKADEVFLAVLESGNSVYIDNTNLTVKRRRPFIEAARQRGYDTVGITFDIDLHVLIERQTTSGDKYVNEGAVTQQFKSLQPPIHGEFTKIYESTRII